MRHAHCYADDFASNRYSTTTRSAKGTHRTLHNLDLDALWVWEGESPHEPVNQSAYKLSHLRP